MLWLVRSTVVAIAVLTACSKDPVGRSFAAEQDLVQALGHGVVVGRFDVAFPARVERIEHAQGGLRFEHNGQAHEYGDVAGVALQAVFVVHQKGQGVLVLRSTQN
jgi:hypothetical protein